MKRWSLRINQVKTTPAVHVHTLTASSRLVVENFDVLSLTDEPRVG